MFGMFSRCPLEVHEKVFIERGFNWLAGQFGSERLLNAEVLTPKHPLFPKGVTGELSEVRELMEKLCEFLGINPSSIELRFFEEDEKHDAAGTWEKTDSGSVIAIDREQALDPPSLAATLLHQLAHEMLSEKAEPPREFATEMMSDLLMPFLGVGIFAANTTVHDQAWSTANWEYWRISRQGYLPSRMFGYAFALFSWLREDYQSKWASELRPDAATPMQKGLKFLKKTGDSVCTITTLGQSNGSISTHQLITDLNQGTPTRALSALLDLNPEQHPLADLEQGLNRCCRAADRHVRAQAPGSVARYENPTDPLKHEMQELLFDNENSVRASAATALSSRKINPEAVVPVLVEYLNNGSPMLREIASWNVRNYGHAAKDAIPAVVKTMIPAIVECENNLLEFLMDTLAAISPDPEMALAEELASRDEEIRRRAIDTWRELREHREQEAAEQEQAT